MVIELARQINLKENYACLVFCSMGMNDNQMLYEVHAVIFDMYHNKLDEFNTIVNMSDVSTNGNIERICDEQSEEPVISQSSSQRYVMKELPRIFNKYCVNTVFTWDLYKSEFRYLDNIK